MPMTKKQRDRLWNGYSVGMVAVYALSFAVVTILFNSAAVGFVAGFISLFISMAGFLILMRVLGTPPPSRP